MTSPALAMHGVHLGYAGVPVLAGAELVVEPGEVHALLGENGAGKSSLLKVLAGAVRMDAGRMELDGVAFAPADPAASRAAGVAMIHQELTVLPHLSVADNVWLGNERRRGWFVDRAARDAAARAALELLGHAELSLSARAGDLPPAARQLVEIARALAQQARVLVMDEPTSSLAGDDVARLLHAIRLLRARGLTIVYVSHVLEEVRAVAARATVLRDGHTVWSGALAAIDDRELVRHMAGRDVALAGAARRDVGGREPVLVLREVGGEPLPVRASLTLLAGEIFGIAGLCGAGRTELLEVLFGLRAQRSGSVEWPGRTGIGVARAGGAAARWRQRIGIVVEDRKQQGLAVQQSIAHNVALPSARRWRRGALLHPQALGAAAAAACAQLRVRHAGIGQRVGELSGGNQQKVAFARLLAADADVWLLDEPTRGIDVGSREELYAALRARAAAGAALLVVSSQLPELLRLCDRIAVMRDGVLGPARAAGEWTQETLLRAALGHVGDVGGDADGESA